MKYKHIHSQVIKSKNINASSFDSMIYNATHYCHILNGMNFINIYNSMSVGIFADQRAVYLTT